MKQETTTFSAWNARRAGVALLCVWTLAASALFSHGYTTAQFTAIQSQITSDIAILSALPAPTRADRAQLRSLARAAAALTKTSPEDGKTLKTLNRIMGRIPSYTGTLAGVASNLRASYDLEYDFVATLLDEVPASPEATAISAQFDRLAVGTAKLRAADTVAKCSGLYDAARRKLDAVFIRANQALLIPFPSDLGANSVSAKINGVNFRTSKDSASENQTNFNAVATKTNISVTLGAILNSGNGPRGITFSVPDAQFGTFRYPINVAASFTNRTGIYSPQESNVGATNGSIFVSTTATEVYGSFSCSGPGFTVTDGRFRITITAAP